MPLEPQLASQAIDTFVMGVSGTATAALALSAFLVPAINKRIIPEVRDDALRDYLPFDSIVPIRDPNQKKENWPLLIRCRDDTFTAILEIGGYDSTFTTDEENRQAWLTAKRFLDSLAPAGVNWRQTTIRRRMQIPSDVHSPAKFARRVLPAYNQIFKGAYNNTRLLMLSGTDKSDKAAAKLQELVRTTLSQLRSFRPKQLSQDPAQSLSGNLTLASALGMIVSPCTLPAPGGTGGYLNAAINADNVDFLHDEKGTIVFRGASKTLYARFVGITELGEHTTPELMRMLSEINAECIFTNSGMPINPGIAQLKLEQEKRMMANTNFGADEIEEQFTVAQNIAAGRGEATGNFHLFNPAIMVLAESEHELDQAEADVNGICADNQVTPIRQIGAAQTSFFGQLPTYKLYPEIYRLPSQNITHFLNFNTPSSGAQRSQWSPTPIGLYPTAQRTIFRWHPHVSPSSNVAHSVHLAITGGGKTTQACWMDTNISTVPNARTIMLDRFWGCYPYVSAMDGTYVYFRGDGKHGAVRGGINPFDCDDTENNRDFLKLWLKTITDLADNESLDQFAQIVDLAFMIERENRSLRAVWDGGGIIPNSKVANALKKWVDPQQYGDLINGRDTIDFRTNRLFGFDMTPILDDEQLAPAFVHYLMHRTIDAMQRFGYLINFFIDETAPALKNATFRKYFEAALQEFRKLRGAVSCVFQRPSALIELGVANLISTQCQSWYIYPSQAADRDVFSAAGLNFTQAEWDFIRRESPIWDQMERGMILKRPESGVSVALNTNLEFLGPLLRPYNSDADNVLMVSLYRQHYGEEWLDRYLSDDTKTMHQFYDNHTQRGE